MESGRDSSILKFIKCVRIPLALTFAELALLALVIFQYIGLASNEQLVKNQSSLVYYTINHTWWKYLLLALEWLFLSHLIENNCTLCVIQTSSIWSGQDIRSSKMTPSSFPVPPSETSSPSITYVPFSVNDSDRP